MRLRWYRRLREGKAGESSKLFRFACVYSSGDFRNTISWVLPIPGWCNVSIRIPDVSRSRHAIAAG